MPFWTDRTYFLSTFSYFNWKRHDKIPRFLKYILMHELCTFGEWHGCLEASLIKPLTDWGDKPSAKFRGIGCFRDKLWYAPILKVFMIYMNSSVGIKSYKCAKLYMREQEKDKTSSKPLKWCMYYFWKTLLVF